MTTDPTDDEHDSDDEEVFASMCAIVSRRTGLPIERVQAIAGDAGLHAYGHCGIVDLLMTVCDDIKQWSFPEPAA